MDKQYFTKIDTSAKFKAEGIKTNIEGVFSSAVVTGFGLIWSLITITVAISLFKTEDELAPKIIMMFFSLIGILLIVFGGLPIFKYLVQSGDFRKAVVDGEVTIGSITEIDVENHKSQYTVRMKYIYKDRNGREHTRMFINNYDKEPPFKKGQDVHVLFYENYAYILNQYRPLN